MLAFPSPPAVAPTNPGRPRNAAPARRSDDWLTMGIISEADPSGLAWDPLGLCGILEEQRTLRRQFNSLDHPGFPTVFS